ncbi:MAG TPA: ATP-binding cassette domain-containing protein, partial [Chloroflexi bacterium]|nr:ATP-binding cassette domain-containing protein [Chloroflexota bacterium]
MIDVEGLVKEYGTRRAIDGLTFHARRGEIVGFLGPNGAGKTTTMRILTGYMPPTEGRAAIAGFDVVADSLEVRRRVGYLPETVPLYPDMSVWDYLEFMGRLRRVPDLETRLETVLEQVGMEERAESYIGALSKGMRQRVGLAQALLHEPEVLILDEPTIGLDPAQVVEVRGLIREIGREHTVLLSTHILSEAQQLCDRVLIINRGRIVAEDTPEGLQTRLQGGRQILVRVANPNADLLPAVSALEGVLRVLPEEDGALRVDARPGVDVRPALAQTLVQNGYDLLELRQAGMSLEEIFLELTQEAAETPAEGETPE